MTHLTLTVDFTIGEGAEEDSFELGGTIKEEAAPEIISNWLRSQMGEGPDTSEPVRRKTYRVEIDWNPRGDVFTCRSNCGNKGLRDGLLLYVLKKLEGTS